MSLPRLGYRETVAYVFKYCLRWLTQLPSHEADLWRDPWEGVWEHIFPV